jgi:ankyrin repeat protein
VDCFRVTNSQTALHLAVIHQQEAIVRVLVNHPKINLESEDRNRSTPLHWAVAKNNVVILKILLEKGVRLDDMNMDGKTPMDLARDKEIRDILKAASKRVPRKFSI